MNGEFTELLEEIKRWSTQVHEQRHRENLAKFERIFEKLDGLPCDRREGFSKYIKWHLGILTTIIFGILFKVFLQ